MSISFWIGFRFAKKSKTLIIVRDFLLEKASAYLPDREKNPWELILKH